ncbi:MAG: hypothetical protein HY421_03210, partial [Candidatus Kerfeldbacteria bacterium]|nr:hypothetical protein [Candidatus Kerfeldbacteria bacterium]
MAVPLLVLMSVGPLMVPTSAEAATKKSKKKYGTVSTFLGRQYAGDGLDANSAYLDNPEGFVADANCTFTITDTLNNVIRRVDGTTNVMSTIAGNGHFLLKDGAAASSSFRWPSDVELGPSGEV